MTEDEMVGWHHQLNGHEFKQVLQDDEGQGRVRCCSPWSCKELDTTEQLSNNTTVTKWDLSQECKASSTNPIAFYNKNAQ